MRHYGNPLRVALQTSLCSNQSPPSSVMAKKSGLFSGDAFKTKKTKAAEAEAERAKKMQAHAESEKRREMEIQEINEKKFQYYEGKNFKIVQAKKLKLEWNYNTANATDEPEDWRGSLEYLVQKHIEIGWKPVGTVFIDKEGIWSPSGGSTLNYYCQAMTKD